MDSCSKGFKRLFEFESFASGHHEASQIETDRAEAKRKRCGDDFEEFVALLDRIQYLKTNHCMNYLGIWEEISIPAEDSAVKVTKNKSPWIPSFEWEDFLGLAAQDTISTHSPRKENLASGDEEKSKQKIQPDNHFQMFFSSDDKHPAECFDLNVEASADQFMA